MPPASKNIDSERKISYVHKICFPLNSSTFLCSLKHVDLSNKSGAKLRTTVIPWESVLPFVSKNCVTAKHWKIQPQVVPNCSMARRVLCTEWQWPLSGVNSFMMIKSAQPGESGGCTLHLLSLYLSSRAKLWLTLRLRGRYCTHFNPMFLLYLSMYSVAWPLVKKKTSSSKSYFICYRGIMLFDAILYMSVLEHITFGTNTIKYFSYFKLVL